jgi:hypothetical protein
MNVAGNAKLFLDCNGITINSDTMNIGNAEMRQHQCNMYSNAMDVVSTATS